MTDDNQMQRMLLQIMFSQWLGLVKNADYESTQELQRQLEGAIAALDLDEKGLNK